MPAAIQNSLLNILRKVIRKKTPKNRSTVNIAVRRHLLSLPATTRRLIFCDASDLAATHCSGKSNAIIFSSLWRACNLTSFSPCLTGPVDYPFAPVSKDLGSKPLGGLM